MVFNFLKKPIKTNSLEGFIDVIEKEGGSSITAQPQRTGINPSYDARGYSGDYQFSTRYSSHTSTGRLIIFDEIYGIRLGRKHGNYDEKVGAKLMIGSAITAEDRLKGMKDALPDVTTNLVDHLGRELTQEDYEQLHEAAHKNRIYRPFKL